MVGDIVRVMVIVADVVGVVAKVVADWIWVSFEVVVTRPPVPVIQVIWPMVIMRPSAMDAEVGVMTILFV